MSPIKGLHHVTAMAKDARRNNRFYTDTLGLRRVKQTVNFDAPDVYHLYYADGAGTPGTVMTFFPFPDIAPGTPGSGEAGVTAFSVPPGALPFWRERLERAGAPVLADTRFGEERLSFSGADGERLALVERSGDGRAPWTGGGVGADAAIRGFHSVELTLRDAAPTAELLRLMGYEAVGTEGAVTRFALAGGNGADAVDLRVSSEDPRARLGAGSVHHVAFAVADRAAQAEVRRMLADAGLAATPAIDRDYFWAIYFREPGGVLFEVATDEPGFARDEAPERLGSELKLPRQHEHLRPMLVQHLPPLEG